MSGRLQSPTFRGNSLGMKHPDVRKYLHLRNALTSEKAQIEERLRQISEALGEVASPSNAAIYEVYSPGAPGRGKFERSPAMKAKMAAAQRSRWARFRERQAQNTFGPTPIGRPSRFGSLRHAIVAELQRVGENGIHIEDLARVVGNKVSNVRLWFYSKAARQLKNIAKVGEATYGWRNYTQPQK